MNLQKWCSDIFAIIRAYIKINFINIITPRSINYHPLTRLKSHVSILAVGPSDVASIQYFEKHDDGFVINDGKEINNKLLYLINNENIMSEYAQKAWACGSKNNNKAKKDEFIQELLNL